MVGWQRQKWEAAGGRIVGATTGSRGIGCESALPAATCHCASGQLLVRTESVKLKLRCQSDLCDFDCGHSRCQAIGRKCFRGKESRTAYVWALPGLPHMVCQS
jgi:hypothetical protein